MAALPNGRVASIDHSAIRIWDTATGRCRILQDSDKQVLCLAVLQDDRLASGSADGSVRIWDVRKRKSRVMNGHEKAVFSLAALPDGRLASGSEDGTIRIWDLNTGESQILTGRSGPVHNLTVLPGGRLASGSREQLSVRIWNLPALERDDTNVVKLKHSQDAHSTEKEERIGFIESPATFLVYWKGCLAVGTEAGLEFFKI